MATKNQTSAASTDKPASGKRGQRAEVKEIDLSVAAKFLAEAIDNPEKFGIVTKATYATELKKVEPFLKQMIQAKKTFDDMEKFLSHPTMGGFSVPASVIRKYCIDNNLVTVKVRVPKTDKPAAPAAGETPATPAAPAA